MPSEIKLAFLLLRIICSRSFRNEMTYKTNISESARCGITRHKTESIDNITLETIIKIFFRPAKSISCLKRHILIFKQR